MIPRLGHHLDQVTEAEFKCDVPSHTQNDDLLVKVPSLEQILCRGRFRLLWQLSDTEPFNSLHQNLLLDQEFPDVHNNPRRLSLSAQSNGGTL